MFDLYHVFIEACLNLLTPNGVLTMIIPNSFLTSQSSKKTREKINILSLTDFGDKKVFDNVDVYTCIITCTKKQSLLKNNIKITMPNTQ